MIGKLLSDRYQILERIGGGGMANVYKAHDNRLGREVAIKILRQEFVEDEDFVENFRKESHAAARLNHPNIVGVFDVGLENINGQDNYYIVMEIVNGKTLKDVINEKGKLGLSETLNYGIQISEAILCAHDNGIIHRDIKPQNIIISRDNLPKVTDFGIAQGANRHTSTEHDIMGSVHYFSPEQARGEKTDERSDIYSLGIVLYEMLTGELPFDGDNPISIALKQVHEKIQLPSKLNSEVPKQLDEIVLKMTNKSPEDRYNNLLEVIDDLKSLEKKIDLEMSDTLVIPISKTRKDHNISVDDQRRIRRYGIESQSQPRSEQKTSSRRKEEGGAGPIIGGILTALLVATLLFFIFTKFPLFSSSKGEEIQVPDIMGVQQDEAQRIVESLGLRFEIDGESINHDFDPGDVIHQNPEGGIMVKKNYVVRVTINSDGAVENDLIEVDDYTGLSLEDAIAQINNDGFDYEVMFEDSEDEEDYNKVLRQDPRSRTRVEDGSKIIIYVGREVEVENVIMPEVKGKSLDFAKSAIESLGLVVGKVERRETTRLSPNLVIESSIEAGEEIEIGTTIDLVMAIEPEPEEPEEEEEPTPTPPPTTTEPVTPPPSSDTGDDSNSNSMSISIDFEIPESKGSANIKVVRIENNTSTEIYNATHYSSEGHRTLSFTGSENAVYQVFVDDVLEETKP